MSITAGAYKEFTYPIESKVYFAHAYERAKQEYQDHKCYDCSILEVVINTFGDDQSVVDFVNQCNNEIFLVDYAGILGDAFFRSTGNANYRKTSNVLLIKECLSRDVKITPKIAYYIANSFIEHCTEAEYYINEYRYYLTPTNNREKRIAATRIIYDDETDYIDLFMEKMSKFCSGTFKITPPTRRQIEAIEFIFEKSLSFTEVEHQHVNFKFYEHTKLDTVIDRLEQSVVSLKKLKATQFD